MSEGLRILIVDDDHSMANTLQDILKVKGYEAEAAYSGREGMEKVAQGHFDCVLTDIKMPEVNGVQLCRAIKAGQPELPVVLMTAYPADNLVNEGLKEGVIDILIKPFEMDKLLQVLAEIPRWEPR